MGRIVEGRWKCPYCKTEEILGRYQVCPTSFFLELVFLFLKNNKKHLHQNAF